MDDYFALPESARTSRADADAVLRRARRDHIPIELAARAERVNLTTVRWWFPDALGPTRHGRTRPTRADRYLRIRTFISGEERVFIPIRGSVRTREAEEANAIQWRYVHGRADSRELERLRGRRIGGRLVQADPDALLEVARRGEFDPDELYRELTA
jgi:hypothetical protein